MQTIAVINQKGGCGKSTAAVHLCRWLNKQGHKVAFVDCDAQGTSSAWLASLPECPASQTMTMTSPDDLIEQVPDLAAQFDYVLIDGAGGLSELTRAILLRADLALVPVKPTGADVRSAADAVRLIKQASSVRSGKPVGAMFLSMAIKGSSLKDESSDVLKRSGLPLLATVIHQRQAIADSFGQSSTVFDMSGRAAADSAREFSQLFSEAIAL
jgi:chromosome partitioning protein